MNYKRVEVMHIIMIFHIMIIMIIATQVLTAGEVSKQWEQQVILSYLFYMLFRNAEVLSHYMMHKISNYHDFIRYCFYQVFENTFRSEYSTEKKTKRLFKRVRKMTTIYICLYHNIL